MTSDDTQKAKQDSTKSHSIVYVFGEFTLVPEQWTLRRGKEVVQLEPKAFDLLRLLIERRGQVVSKQEILATVWPGIVVEEVALARNISALRSLFNDTPPYTYVATIRNQGYSFVAEVSVESLKRNDQPRTAALIRKTIPRKTMLAAATIFAACCIWLFYVLVHHAFADEYSIKQLTKNSSELPIVFASLSHDGKKVALIEGTHLYLDTNTLSQRSQVELPAGVAPTVALWFPDDLHLLATVVDQHTHLTSLLKISPLADSVVPLITGNVSWTAISPDGKQIAFLRPDNCELWLANSDGSQPARLLSFGNTCPVYGLQYYQHANELVFIHGNSSMMGTTVGFYNIATHELKETSLNYAVSALSKARDNKVWISFWSGTALSGSTLGIADMDFREGKIGPVKKIATWSDLYVARIFPSSADSTVFLNASKYQSDVLIADWDDDTGTASNFRRLTLNDASDRPSAWYDNKSLLFYSNRLGPYGIYRQTIDSMDVTAIVNNQQQNVRAEISGDGKWMYYLAVQGDTVDAPGSLISLSLQNGSRNIIRDASSLTDEFRCAARADICVFARSVDGQLVFYKLEPTNAQTELARVPWNPVRTIYTWDLSPDGRNIAYIDTVHQSHDIKVISIGNSRAAATFNAQRISDTLLSVSWDARGTGIFISSMSMATGFLSQSHLSADGTAHLLRGPVWDDEGWIIPSPDSKHLALQTYTNTGNIWELTRR